MLLHRGAPLNSLNGAIYESINCYALQTHRRVAKERIDAQQFPKCSDTTCRADDAWCAKVVSVNVRPRNKECIPRAIQFKSTAN